MRRFALLLTIATAASFAAGSAHAVTPAPGGDYVVGSGTYNGCLVPPIPPICYSQKPFSVSASANPGGTQAHGVYTFGTPGGVGLYLKVKVTCVNAVGNMASVGGIIKTASSTTVSHYPIEGQSLVVYFVDNGPSVGGVSPDLASPPDIDPATNAMETALPADFPNTCPPPVSPIGYMPVGSGDVVVGDAA